MIDISVWLALFGLPLVGALHAFAAGYGYHRLSRDDALRRAEIVGLMLAAISISLMIMRVLHG